MKVVVLTGAGISAESGLRTFRDADGLWEGHRAEDVCSVDAFRRNPDLVYDFYNQRRRQLQEASIVPNAAHIALARFEARHNGDFLLVTQNVDDLHERSGSIRVLHMHGELLKARCLDSGRRYKWRGDMDRTTPHPDDPNRRGRLRPDIVWFGEMPLHMDRIITAVSQCDLFVSIGTSGLVYPAAGLVAETRSDCRKIEFNLNATGNAIAFDEHIVGPASETVTAFFDQLEKDV